MAAFEVIALDTATPQLRAPGASDTYTFPRAVELPLGTANGVLYLNGSKVVTSGSALTFDGTNLNVGSTAIAAVSGGSVTAGVISARAPLAAHQTGAAILQYTASEGAIRVYGESGSAGQLVFNLGIGGSVDSEQMRLTSTGLGIGTSSPSQRLHVSSAGNDLTGFTLQNTSTNGRQYVLAAAGRDGYFDAPAGSFAIRDITGSATRVVLDSSGNLGLGVTPSAWGGIKPIQAGTAASFSGGSGFNDAFVASNAFYDGANWKYINTNPAYYASVGGAAAARWYTAPSGTAGDAISFSQVMTLDASGNLGVGATNPASFGKFVVRNTDDRYFSVDTSGVPLARYDDNGAPSFVLQNSGITGASHGYGIEARLGSSVANTGVAGYIRFITEGVWGSTAASQDAAIAFGTTVDGATAERARITSGGSLVVGTAALATTATDGFLYVPTCAGTPTGTPTTQTGTAPIVVDTTNNKLYFYSGGQWRDAGP